MSATPSHTPPPADTHGAPPLPASTPVKAWQSEEILSGQKEVLIQHGEETYRLRLTRAGKLILYK